MTLVPDRWYVVRVHPAAGDLPETATPRLGPYASRAAASQHVLRSAGERAMRWLGDRWEKTRDE